MTENKNSDFTAQIGTSLKQWREVSHKSIDQVAQESGVSSEVVSQIEQGDSWMRIDDVLKVAQTLGLLEKLKQAFAALEAAPVEQQEEQTEASTNTLEPEAQEGNAQEEAQPKQQDKPQPQPAPAVEQPWLTEANWYDGSMVYQIYPLGLTGAPWRNDGSAEGATNDDPHRLLKIIDDGWIAQAKKLGATCIMLNPVFESDSHGYDTRDYTKVDSRLGTNEDLRAVVDAAHQQGIKVILDAVLNHVGRGFWAFQDVIKNRQDSKYVGWFNIDWNSNSPYNDGFSYESWQGVSELVQLNHNNLELNNYLNDVILRWEKEFDIDGLRLDVAYCLDPGYLKYLRQTANQLTEKRHQKFLLMGETMFGDYNQWMGDDACDTVYNYEAYKGLWSSMNSSNMHEIAYSLERQSGDKPWDLYTGKHLFNFLDNHDTSRIASTLNDKKQLKPLYGLLFGMPGVPAVYYGSEWGIEGEKKFGDHEQRPSLDKPEWNDLTDWIQTLTKARLTTAGAEALCEGDYHELLCQPKQLVFQRACESGRVIVAINADSKPAHLDFNAQCGQGTNLITGEQHDFGGGSDLGAYDAAYWLCEK